MKFDRKEHHTATGFKNPEPGFEQKNFKDLLQWTILDRVKGRRPARPERYDFPISFDPDQFKRSLAGPASLTWIGHTSFLITINGVNILTDPIWSDRCAPVQFAGPKRHVPPGIPFAELPPIDIVLISHDHYDHLDLRTIKRLGNRPLYFVPLKLRSFFIDLGITNVSEHDWWDGDTFNRIKITATPARHFSGRGLWDRNRTLWCGWMIETSSSKLYFAGDSGYFGGFREIGRQFPGIDLALLPIGAYLPRWFMKPVHMSPEEAVQAFVDLKARLFVATHWGTFDLADEPLDDPPQKLKDEILRKGLDQDHFWILEHGESRALDLSATDNIGHRHMILEDPV
jgi:L-ascorbate metabolism protein UlaG (beta-lactamase superfamily)